MALSCRRDPDGRIKMISLNSGTLLKVFEQVAWDYESRSHAELGMGRAKFAGVLEVVSVLDIHEYHELIEAAISKTAKRLRMDGENTMAKAIAHVRNEKEKAVKSLKLRQPSGPDDWTHGMCHGFEPVNLGIRPDFVVGPGKDNPQTAHGWESQHD